MKRILGILGLLGLLITPGNAQEIGFLHYAGDNPPPGCDSLCGPRAWFLADKAHYGVSGGGHAIPTLQRTPNFKWFKYNSLTDNYKPSPTAPNTILDEDYQWELFLTARGHHELYEKSFLHWAEDTTIYYETPFGNCFAVVWPAGSRVRAYGLKCPASTCPPTGPYPGPACPSGTILGQFDPATYGKICPCDFHCPNNDCDGGDCADLKFRYCAPLCKSPGCTPGQTCTGLVCPPDPGFSLLKNIYDGADGSLSGTIENRFYINFSDSLDATGARVVGEHNLFRQLYKEFICSWDMQTNGLLPGSSTIYYDGLFLDNAAYALYQLGTPLSGGKIRECGYKPAQPGINNDFTPFFTWYRGTYNDSDPTQENGMIGFIQALGDTFALAATWHPGAKPLYTLPNISVSIDRPYPSNAIKYCEFEGSVLRPVSSYAQTVWTATSTGRTWLGPSESGSCVNCTNTQFPTITRTFGSWCLYLLTYNGDDIWGMQFNTNQCNTTSFKSDKRWKEKALGLGAIEATTVSNYPGYLGNFTSNPIVARDTLWTSLGAQIHVKIWQRSFENGLVYERNKANGTESNDSLSNRWSYTLPNPPNDSAGNQRMWRMLNYDGSLQSAQYNGGARIWIAAGRGQIFVLKRLKGSNCIPDCTKHKQDVVDPTVTPSGKYANTPSVQDVIYRNDSDAGAANPIDTNDPVAHDVVIAPSTIAAGDEFWATLKMGVGGPSSYTLRTVRLEVSYDSTKVMPLYFDNSVATTFFPDSTCALPSLSDSVSAGYGMRPACTSFAGRDINKAIRYIQWQNCGTSSEVLLKPKATDPELVLGRIRFRAIASTADADVLTGCGSDVTNFISAGAATILTGRREFDRLSVGTIYVGHAGYSGGSANPEITGSFDPSTRWSSHPDYAEFATEIGQGFGIAGRNISVPVYIWADTLLEAHIALHYPNGLSFKGFSAVATDWTIGVEDSAASACGGRYVICAFHKPDGTAANFAGNAFEAIFQAPELGDYPITFCDSETSSLELGPAEANSVPIYRVVYNKPTGAQRWTHHADGLVTAIPNINVGRGR